MDTASQEQPLSPRPPRSKRGRLSLACTQCRKRKVRCDATTPKCRNCVLRGDECETFDPRRPNGPAVRKWPHKSSQSISTISPIQRRASIATASQQSSPASSIVGSQHAGNKERNPSWIERAYQESQSTPDSGTDVHTNDSPDVVMNTDESSHRIKYMGSSSLQCLTRFIDLFLQRRGFDPIGRHFRWGMCFTEEYALPLVPILPDLPSMSVMEPCLKKYFSRTHPLVPVLDHTAFISDVLRFSEMQQTSPTGLQGAVTSVDAPALVAVYAVLSIGMDDHEGQISPTATGYLTGAYSLVSHLLSLPYMSSVQALVLLAIAMRARGKDGQCWHLLGQAIRIGYSIGFHRKIVISNPNEDSGNQIDRQLHSRVWWACYALEKSMQLETGRPSAIEITDCDQPLPDKTSGLDPCFIRWVSLSLLVGKISEHIFQRRAETALEFLSGISELDQALVDWLDEASEDTKTNQSAPKSSEERSFAVFLSLQFHQAQITLLRASLLFPEASFSNEVQKHEAKISTTRLLQSQTTCVEAARSIITQVAEFADSQPDFPLLTPTPTFLAATTLALQTFKKPHKRMGRSDGELVRIASDYVADCYRRVGQHSEFVKGVLELTQRVNQVLSGDNSSSVDQTQRPPQPDLQTTNNDQRMLSPNQFGDVGTDLFAFDPLEYFQDPFQAMPLDHFWAVMESDFATIGDQGMC
ncbi:STB5-transcription factor [Fusarium pseudocircinatum]|uniref:STB5-transcription factor n=1 Tax=Fusarium pseudocircinatum TaxID=56676 RepID=A0A8H5PI07_9HYPO|nr:STB5-transcription factor [Fusarium pseudocircinatum]